MKKLFLACLIGFGLLLPTINNTTTAAAHFNKRVVNTGIIDWVFMATSGVEDGPINMMEIWNLNTGLKVASTECGGYSCSIDMHGFPHASYSAKIYCQNIPVVIKQFRL